MSTAYYLAVDLGTSGPKAGVVSSAGAVVGKGYAPTQLRLLPGGGAEQEPDDWWRAVVQASRAAIEDSKLSPSAITHVSVTAQWSGTVCLDAAGAVIGNAIIWMDARGRKQMPALCGGFPQVDGYNIFRALRWMKLTGGAPGLSGKDPIAHILWLRDEQPDIYARTAIFLEPKDYLNYRLTGERISTFDTMTLHWVTDNRDLANIRYHDKLLRIAGIDRTKLPPMVKATDVIGTLTDAAASELGLPKTVEVVGGTPDVTSAILGSGASRDYACHVYIGTSSWLTTHIPFKKTDMAGNMGSLPAALPGRYFLGNSQETAGACLNTVKALIDADGRESHDALLQRAAGAPAGSGKLLFLPWIYGERSPVADSLLRGGFVNLSLASTQSEMVRSMLEGVAYNGRWLLEVVEKFIKRETGPLNFIGGGARSALWCAIHADVMQRPVRQMAEPQQANVRGAGLLAAIAAGHTTPDAMDASVPVSATFEPNPANRGIYDELYAAFRQSFKATRPIMHGLNR